VSVHPNNHKSIWGSYYDKPNSAWGYTCCHSLTYNSYCTGKAGIAANTSTSVTALLETAVDKRRIDEEAEAERSRVAEQVKHAEAREKERAGIAKRKEGNEDLELDRDRLKRAVEEEKKRKAMGDDEAWAKSKKAKTDVSQEELGTFDLPYHYTGSLFFISADDYQKRTD
jgi:pre-mRNA-processing factor SLU7